MYSKTKQKSAGERWFGLLAMAILIFAILGCGNFKFTSQQKIVGRWSGKAFDNKTNVSFVFTESGEAITSANGIEIGKEKYRFTDKETLELETPKGLKYTVKVNFTDKNNTMEMTAATGIRTTYRRE